MEASIERFKHFYVRRVIRDGLQIRKRDPESTESVLPVGTKIIIPCMERHPEEWMSVPATAIPIRLLRDPDGYWGKASQVMESTAESTVELAPSDG